MCCAFKDLDEYSEVELKAELSRRHCASTAGICDYCNRDGLTEPCRFPQRHEVARARAAQIKHNAEVAAKTLARQMRHSGYVPMSNEPQCGKSNCRNLGKHVVMGSLNYHACDDHLAEIEALTANE